MYKVLKKLPIISNCLSTAHFPESIQLELLNVCNLRCPICDISELGWHEPVFFPAEAVAGLVEQTQVKPRLWTLYGRIGEPLLHPEIIQIIHIVHSEGQTVSRLSTNGMVLRGKKAEEILQSPLTELIIAVDAVTAESYSIYRRGGDFKLLCENIKYITARKKELRKDNPRIILQFIPMKHNETELGEFVDFAKELGSDGVRIKISGSIMRNADYAPDGKLLAKFDFPLKEADSCKLKKLYVDSRGNVYPCCYVSVFGVESNPFYFGNVRDIVLDGIQRGANFRRLRQLFGRGEYPQICRERCIECKNRKYYRVDFAKQIVKY